jgi:hypothetical protein
MSNAKNINLFEREMFRHFHNHIVSEENSRILFSAPYGVGKTTFLSNFFRVHEKDYFLIRLYPVNYSVASNEDIFQLIKHDILFQILNSTEIDFKIETFNHIETIWMYYNAYKSELLSKLFSFLPKTGNAVIDNIEKIYALLESYGNNRIKGAVKDEKKDIKKHITDIESSLGAIYEDDFVTILINDLITKTKKQPILIIDDLDRLDPEHIFRILNIYSCHFDRPNRQDKFNFSKVIIVCDIDNIKSIYKHKYGIKTDFHGYINKFYSTKVYEFTNVEQTIKWVLQKCQNDNEETLMFLDNYDLKFLQSLLNSMIIYRVLSFRDILKLNYHREYAPKTRIVSDENLLKCRLSNILDVLKLLIGDIYMVREKLDALIEISNSDNKLLYNRLEDIDENYKKFLFPILGKTKHYFIPKEFTYSYVYPNSTMHSHFKLILELNGDYYETKATEDFKDANVMFWSDFKKSIDILNQAGIN